MGNGAKKGLSVNAKTLILILLFVNVGFAFKMIHKYYAMKDAGYIREKTFRDQLETRVMKAFGSMEDLNKMVNDITRQKEEAEKTAASFQEQGEQIKFTNKNLEDAKAHLEEEKARMQREIYVVHARGSGLLYMETNYALPNPYEVQVIDPRFASIEQMTNVGWTHYTALQSHARYRRSPLDVGLAYTLSKADSNITTAGIFPSTPTNPFDLDQDEGPDATDQRHNVVLNGSYLFPFDFQLAGLVVWRSARPWTVRTNENPEGYVFPPLPEGKNSRRGDSEKTVDLRVSKTFRFGQRASATIFWEMFNALASGRRCWRRASTCSAARSDCCTSM